MPPGDPDAGVVLAGEVVPAAGDVAVLDEVDGWVAAWLDVCAGSPHTRRAYRADFTDWRTFATGRGVDVLEPPKVAVDAWVTAVKTTVSPRTGALLATATVARRISAVASFYAFLLDSDRVERTPVRKKGRPKPSDTSTTVGLSRDEGTRLLHRLQLEEAGIRAALTLLLLGGLRVGELCRLTIGDRRFNEGEMTVVVHGKGGRVREVPLDDRVIAAIGEHLAERGIGDDLDDETLALPLVANDGRPFSQQQLYRAVQRVARAAGILSSQALSNHSLRHAFITGLLEAGRPLHVAQELAGHATPKTTVRYDRNRGRIARAADAVRALSDHFQPPTQRSPS